MSAWDELFEELQHHLHKAAHANGEHEIAGAMGAVADMLLHICVAAHGPNYGSLAAHYLGRETMGAALRTREQLYPSEVAA